MQASFQHHPPHQKAHAPGMHHQCLIPRLSRFRVLHSLTAILIYDRSCNHQNTSKLALRMHTSSNSSESFPGELRLVSAYWGNDTHHIETNTIDDPRLELP